MKRKDFFKALGVSSATVIFASCLNGCSKSSNSNTVTPPNVDFTLDINLPANAALKNNGGYIYSNGVIVAKTVAGDIIAVSQACTHEGVSVQYQQNKNQFYCPSHGALFSTSGGVVSGPVNAALKQYAVTITGNLIRISG